MIIGILVTKLESGNWKKKTENGNIQRIDLNKNEELKKVELPLSKKSEANQDKTVFLFWLTLSDFDFLK